MSAPQSTITIMAEVAADAAERLRPLLSAMNEHPAANDIIPFGELPHTHYARLVIVDEEVDEHGQTAAANLLFMADFDGSARRYLRHLVRAFGPGLDRIYCHCKGYPEVHSRSPAACLAYLRSHRVRSDATYVNTIGRTVEQIRGEARLRDAIERFLDRNANDWIGYDAPTVRERIRSFVRADPTLAWALQPERPLSRVYRLQGAIHLIGLPLVAIILLPVLIVVAPLWMVLIRIREQFDPAPHVKPNPAHVATLRAAEDFAAQNQFSAVGFLKAGRLRLVTARVVLLLVNYGVRHLFNRGNLAGVKTIHFARWVSLNNGRRMIFISNYDGTLESYMDDFVDKLAWGLNAVFSNGVGYPKTRWLIFGGAKDEGAFKDHLRRRQIRTDVWYAAYAPLTALNIENNARIRAGLLGDMSASEAQTWLARL